MSEWTRGRHVNLEFDVIGKYIVNAFDDQRSGGGMTRDGLRELGY